MRELFGQIDEAIARGERIAVATIARTRGSTPRERGAKMIVASGGGILGTVGGGCGEADVWRTALNVIEDGRPRMVHIDLTEEIDLKSEGVCGGTLDVFVDPWGPEQRDLLLDARRGLLPTIDRREAVALCTVVERGRESRGEIGAKMVVDAVGGSNGSLGDDQLDKRAISEAVLAIRSGIGSIATVGLDGGVANPSRHEDLDESAGTTTDVLIEVHLPNPTLLILGAGHIAVPLASMAKALGFRVAVVDDRASFASRERFPDSDEVIAAGFESTLKDYPIGPSTFVVLVTRAHQYDVFSLRQIINRDFAYVGMIGSQRRVWAVFKLLHDEGISPERIARIHAPIGIDLKAETPAEIAVSILAEIIKIRRGGGVPSLSDRLRDRYLSRLRAGQALD